MPVYPRDGFMPTATALVVASNAPPALIVAAMEAKDRLGDLIQICAGADDHLEIKAAFGALPDGVGRVVLSTGRFSLGSSFDISTPYSVELIGQGEGTILDGNNTCTPITIGSTANPYRLYIAHFKIIQPDPSGYGIYIKQLTDGVLKNIWINAGGRGIQADAMYNSKLINLRVQGWKDYGLYLAAGNGNSIQQSYFNEYSAPYDGTGIYLASGISNWITDCIFETNYRAIAVYGDECHIRNCYVEDGRGPVDIYVSGGNHSVENVYGNGNNSVDYFLRISRDSNDFVVKGCKTTKYVESDVDYCAYAYGRGRFIANRWGKPSVVLDERDIESIKAQLSTILGDAEIILPVMEQGGDVLRNIEPSTARDARMYGNPTRNTGRLGEAYVDFDGSSQYALIPESGPDPTIDLSGSNTFVMVVSPDFDESEDAHRYLMMGRVDGSNYVLICKRNNADGNVLRFNLRGSGTTANIEEAVGFSAGDMMLLIGTYDNSTNEARFYYNGRKIGSDTGGNISSTATRLNLMQYYDGSYKWDGKLYLFARLRRAVSDEEQREIAKQLGKVYGIVVENTGTVTASGDGTTTDFQFAHGLSTTPGDVKISPKSDDAAGDWKWSADGTNITISFMTAPASGTNNVVFSWRAWV